MARRIALAAFLLASFAAGAQAPDARTQRLAEAARKEGDVMVYHSTQSEDLRPVFDAFTKKYGVKVREWRSSSENIVQRVIRESNAGRHDVDLIENNLPELEALRREKLLRRIDSPVYADLRANMAPDHHEYAVSTMDVFVQAYNTQKVKREELPKTYQDLLDPRWKGRLGIEAEDEAWFGTLVNALGPERGLKLFRDIVATNGISVRKGHTLLAQLVASGEIPLALTVYNYKPPQLKAKGGTIDWFVMAPVIAQMHGVAVHKDAPHPNAAELLHDFFLSEGQAILAARDFVASSRKVSSPFDNMEIHFIDPAEAIDKDEQWTKLWEQNVTKRSTP
jgi:iron(III) transport system substrate-binding protein